VSLRVGFERGRAGCGTGVACGDARATRSVRWPPALPYLFAVEAGPPLLPEVRPGRRRGPDDFAPSRRLPGAWVSDPRSVPLPGGRRAQVLCGPAGGCVATVPLGPGGRAWFVVDAPGEAGSGVLAVDAFARDVLAQPPARSARAHY
jgi:hypothetical protein